MPKPVGRPSKPTAHHRLVGSYRKDRHGGEGERFEPQGELAKPDDLTGDAAVLWNRIASELEAAGVARGTDATMLGELCRWYGRYREYSAKLDQTNPEDKAAYRLLTMTQLAFKNVASLAVDFGLSPSSRARLPITTKPTTDKDRFFNVKPWKPEGLAGGDR